MPFARRIPLACCRHGHAAAQERNRHVETNRLVVPRIDPVLFFGNVRGAAPLPDLEQPDPEQPEPEPVQQPEQPRPVQQPHEEVDWDGDAQDYINQWTEEQQEADKKDD